MDTYLAKYDSFTYRVIFKFSKGWGGIGDLTKFFLYALHFCIINNIRLYYLADNPMDRFFKLKYDKMYITTKQFSNPVRITNIKELNNMCEKPTDVYYIIEPPIMYHKPTLYDEIKQYNLNELFYFTDVVVKNADRFTKKPYISLHLRLGDKFLETDVKYVLCKNDTRSFNEENIYQFIEKNANSNIMFFCDNNGYKLKLKEKYNSIIITDYNIGHTSLPNTTESQILDALTEFYIMTQSEHIYMASSSGFSVMASRFHNIPICSI